MSLLDGVVCGVVFVLALVAVMFVPVELEESGDVSSASRQ